MGHLRYIGDPVLRTRCEEVEKIDDFALKVAGDLLRFCKEVDCSGLAAPQLGYPIRMYAVVLSDEVDSKGYPIDAAEVTLFMNPVITRVSKETVLMEEGCMSIPGIRANVRRSRTIDIRAVNPFTRETFEEKGLSSWRARCILHEEDHINGILFIDRLDNDEKKRIEADLLIVEQRYRYHVPKNIL